jgi:hypothetical protein
MGASATAKPALHVLIGARACARIGFVFIVYSPHLVGHCAGLQ